MWNSRPPPILLLHGKIHLKFSFWLFEDLPYPLLTKYFTPFLLSPFFPPPNKYFPFANFLLQLFSTFFHLFLLSSSSLPLTKYFAIPLFSSSSVDQIFYFAKDSSPKNIKQNLYLLGGQHKKFFFFIFRKKTEPPPPPPFLTTSVFSDKDFFDSAKNGKKNNQFFLYKTPIFKVALIHVFPLI